MIKPYKGRHPRIDESCFVAETAAVIGDVEIGPRCSIWFGASLRGDVNYIRIGPGSNVQDNVTCHVDRGTFALEIGEQVTLGHNCVVHGCTIEDRCLVGMGAVVLDGAVIGEGSIVAAGAVVTPGTTVPPRSLVAGVPAKVVRELSGADIQMIVDNAGAYIELNENYLGEGV